MRFLIVFLSLLFFLPAPVQAQYLSYNLQGAGGRYSVPITPMTGNIGSFYGGQNFPDQRQTYQGITEIGPNLKQSDITGKIIWGFDAALGIWRGTKVLERAIDASVEKARIGYPGSGGYYGGPIERRYVVETREVRHTVIDETDEWQNRARVEQAKETFYDNAEDTLRTKSRYLETKQGFEKKWGGELVSDTNQRLNKVDEGQKKVEEKLDKLFEIFKKAAPPEAPEAPLRKIPSPDENKTAR